MAIVEQRVCDVFKTSKDVQQIRLLIETAANKKDNVTERVANMSPRALKRLEKSVARAFAPPNPKGK